MSLEVISEEESLYMILLHRLFVSTWSTWTSLIGGRGHRVWLQLCSSRHAELPKPLLCCNDKSIPQQRKEVVKEKN